MQSFQDEKSSEDERDDSSSASSSSSAESSDDSSSSSSEDEDEDEEIDVGTERCVTAIIICVENTNIRVDVPITLLVLLYMKLNFSTIINDYQR